MNLNRKSKRRDQNRLIFFQVLRMSMAWDVGRNGVFGPTPISQRAGKKFELPAGRGKATFDFTINFHAHQSSSFPVAVRTRNGHDIWRSRFCGATEVAT